MAKMSRLTTHRGPLRTSIRSKTVSGCIRPRYYFQSRSTSTYNASVFQGSPMLKQHPNSPSRPYLRYMIGNEEVSGLENGCVLLRLHPRPRDMHDTRLVMREIEKFGKVLVWRNARVRLNRLTLVISSYSTIRFSLCLLHALIDMFASLSDAKSNRTIISTNISLAYSAVLTHSTNHQ